MVVMSAKPVALAAFVFLCTSSLCKATIRTTATQFIKGKMVATSYITLQPYSDIACVRKCFDEKKQNRCSVAGYHASTKTCFLSNDGQWDLLDTDDNKYGVFFYSDQAGMLSYINENYTVYLQAGYMYFMLKTVLLHTFCWVAIVNFFWCMPFFPTWICKIKS